MIDVKQDQTVETQDNDLIEIFVEYGEIVLILAVSLGGDEVDFLASRSMTPSQADELIKAIEKAKEQI